MVGRLKWMKKMGIAVLLSLALSVTTYAAQLSCVILDAGTEAERFNLYIGEHTRLKVSDHAGFEFFVKQYNGGDFEIEVYDPYAIARTYARANLNSPEDFLIWSLWTRYASLDMTCWRNDL